MKPDTRTLTELFERDVRYLAPLYQRPYVWNAKKQWQPLWEDILVLLDHQLTPAAHSARPTSHFLGAIVLEQRLRAPGEIPAFTIIDGQQRLTTLQLLLAAAASVASELECPDEAELLRELVENDRRRADGDEQYKVWPTNLDQQAFRLVMKRGGPAEEAPDGSGNLIGEAYSFFSEAIEAWVTDETEHTHARRLKALRITLSDLLRVVSITLEAEDNAQVIFETLNDRGTALLALDLVKNAVFYEALRRKLPVERLYEDIWRPQLDAKYWRAKKRQGRLYRARGELFLMHWLGMKTRSTVPATELFTTFKSEILRADPGPEPDHLIMELCGDADVFRSFDNQPEGSVEERFFRRLAPLDTTTVLPLVLLLFRERTLSAGRRRRALQVLESWMVRRMLMKLTTKNYNEQVALLLRRIGERPGEGDEVLLDQMKAGEGDISRWPASADLRQYLETRNAYDNITPARVAMVLAAVEESLHTSRTEAFPLPTDLSIEHLIPQESEQNWPLPSSMPQVDAREARLNRIHRFGNLTLVTIPLNSAMSNSPWTIKKNELNKGSRLLMNAEILDKYPNSFDEADIDERTSLLAERICAIWPGPDETPVEK